MKKIIIETDNVSTSYTVAEQDRNSISAYVDGMQTLLRNLFPDAMRHVQLQLMSPATIAASDTPVRLSPGRVYGSAYYDAAESYPRPSVERLNRNTQDRFINEDRIALAGNGVNPEAFAAESEESL